ncbi:MAG: hypothetical protein H6Q73_968 [Firmicutes bacterium]|nr:hypothetical protein [Bacillota bacterium]
MKNTIIAILMGVVAFGGAINHDISKANASDFIQWYWHTDQIMARVTSATNVPRYIAAYFLQEGNTPHDVVMAGMLTSDSKDLNIRISSMTEILSMKKINNSWLEVAEALGVDKETCQEYLDRVSDMV